jgi:membrane-anchored protein YejM (alkaline phosphatase superfamily)
MPIYIEMKRYGRRSCNKLDRRRSRRRAWKNLVVLFIIGAIVSWFIVHH